jgi:hypothetical protein
MSQKLTGRTVSPCVGNSLATLENTHATTTIN